MLKNKVIIITGAGRGIGRLITEGLVAHGAVPVIGARTVSEIESLREALRESGCRNVLGGKLDISSSESISDFVEMATNTYKKIDGLINNAAIPGPVAPLEKTDIEQWEETIEINLIGAVRMSRMVLPIMKKKGSGVILNICGGAIGWNAESPFKTAYRTSKYGIYGFTESLAAELKDTGIRVNAILPGSFDTGLQRTLVKSDQQTPLETCSTTNPEDIVETVRMMFSEELKRLNGKIISAGWDNLKREDADDLMTAKKELYTLKRIDGRNYIKGVER